MSDSNSAPTVGDVRRTARTNPLVSLASQIEKARINVCLATIFLWLMASAAILVTVLGIQVGNLLKDYVLMTIVFAIVFAGTAAVAKAYFTLRHKELLSQSVNTSSTH